MEAEAASSESACSNRTEAAIELAPSTRWKEQNKQKNCE